MKSLTKSLLVFYFLCFVGIKSLYAQCMLYPVSLTERVQQSDLILEGTVINQSSFWNSANTLIFTTNTIQVHKIFKGALSVNQIEVITEGGVVGNLKEVVEPNLELKVNQSGILFLNSAININPTSPAVQYEPYASEQGMIKYDAKQLTARDPFNNYFSLNDIYNSVIAITASSYQTISNLPSVTSNNISSMVPPVIGGIVPALTTAGTFSTITISGSNFGASYIAGTSNVEFPDANNGGAGYISTPANHIVSWNSTTIQVWVPTQAGSGNIRVTNNLGEVTVSGISITVNYNESNVNSGGVYYQPDLISDNGAGGYTFVYNTTFNANVPAVQSFERALQTWRCATYVNFNKSGTTAIACQALDNVNVITFDGSCALPAGVLGTSYSFYSSCGGGVWYLNENDCKWRTNGTGGITWQYGPALPAFAEYDFESVAVHELGHSHQLGHTILPVTVMNYALPNGTARRGLTAGSEVAGGNDIMSRSVIANACGPAPMISLNAGNCSINAPLADFSGSPVSGCKPLTVNFTDLSIGTPTSWSWTFTGGVPAASGLQNPVVTYNAAGTYSVTLVATNASGSDTRTKTSYITVTDCTPVADFTKSPNGAICEGQTINFFDASTNTPTGWSWTFPGGVPAASALQNPSVSYAVAGTYNVTLQVTNAYGTNTITKTGFVTVNSCPPPPVANFTGAPTTVCSGNTVIFTDASTNSPTSWSWTFPGGTPLTSIAQNPVVTYNTPGVYNVILTATNSGGSNTFTRNNYITVNTCSAPVANLAGYPTTVCAGQSVNFSDLSTNTPTSWSWTFVGGVPAASAVQNPVVNYAAAGTYNVSLTVTNAFGSNPITFTNYITVSNCPPAGSGLIVNDGALIYSQAGAQIYAQGGIITQDNGINIGNWDNTGQVELTGDWTNTSASNAFINSSPGDFRMSGSNQLITGTTPTYFYNLTLLGTGTKTQTLDAQVQGTLALNDRELATGDYIMYVKNTAAGAVTRTGGFNSTPVQGFVSSTNNGKLWRNTAANVNYLFPVGSSVPPARYRPVQIMPSNSAANTYAVRCVNNDPNTNGYNRVLKDPTLGAINPNWYQRITQINGTSAADITLYVDNVADGIASFPLMKMAEWGFTGPPVQWKDLNLVSTVAAVSPALGSITRPAWNIYTTENFSIAPQSNPLPVELLSFTADCKDDYVFLKWITASETENQFFTIERSIDAKYFEVIGTVNGSGTTNILHEYSIKDQFSFSSTFYYRLSQTDDNGKTQTFDLIAMNCKDRVNFSNNIIIYPNPAHHNITVAFNLVKEEQVKINLINNIGQIVLSKEFEFSTGLNKINLDVDRFSSGIYTVVVYSDNQVISKSISKQD